MDEEHRPSPPEAHSGGQIIAGWSIFAAWAALIFLFSSLPGSCLTRIFTCQDVVFHSGVYAVFSWLFIRAMRISSPGMNLRFIGFLSVLCALLYGASDEFHQLFVPGRSASLFDVFIDTAGGAVGAVSYPLFLRKN